MDNRMIDLFNWIETKHGDLPASKLSAQDKVEIQALLTAELEPCNDARSVACTIDEIWKVIGDDTGETAKQCLDIAAKQIESYASRVSDKRVEELRVKLDETTRKMWELNTELAEARENVDILANQIEIVSPYVIATINNPTIGDKSEWFSIHAGRARSSRVQLENLMSKACEALATAAEKHKEKEQI